MVCAAAQELASLHALVKGKGTILANGADKYELTAVLVILKENVYDDPDFLEAALTSGASGYVVKSRMTSDLCVAIHESLAGRLFISPSPGLDAARTT